MVDTKSVPEKTKLEVLPSWKDLTQTDIQLLREVLHVATFPGHLAGRVVKIQRLLEVVQGQHVAEPPPPQQAR